MQIFEDIGAGVQSLKVVANTLLRLLRQTIPCERAAVILFDPSPDQDRVLAVHGGNGFWPGLEACEPRSLSDEIDGFGSDEMRLRAGTCGKCLQIPIDVAGRTLGTLILSGAEAADFDHQALAHAQDVAAVMAAVVDSENRHRAQGRHVRRLRALQDHMEAVREEERRQWARELHDQLGQNLAALNIYLGLFPKLPLQDGDNPADPGAVCRLATDTSEAIRRIMTEMRPGMLDDWGLGATLNWHGQQSALLTGIPVNTQVDERIQRLPAPVEITFFRIVQEALKNVDRHSGATDVRVGLTQSASHVCLTVADDGVGFEPPDDRGSRAGWGLVYMAERARAVGAEFVVQSQKGQGTRISVSLPKLVDGK